MFVLTTNFNRLVLRTKELESKLELEHATRSRLEVQCNRHKESLEKTQTELMHIRSKETLLQEELKKMKKTLRYFNLTFFPAVITKSNYWIDFHWLITHIPYLEITKFPAFRSTFQ